MIFEPVSPACFIWDRLQKYPQALPFNFKRARKLFLRPWLFTVGPANSPAHVLAFRCGFNVSKELSS